MINRLDQKIAIERELRAADGAGGSLISWGPVPADPAPYAGVALGAVSEREQNGRKIAVQSAVFTVRARADLRASDRILWDGREWNVRGFALKAGRRFLEITAEAGG